MIRIVDRAVALCPAIAFTLFVDNLGIDLIGGPLWVEKQLSKVNLAVCEMVTSSCSELGRGLEKRLAKFGVKLVERAKSL